MTQPELRSELLRVLRAMSLCGLNRGTSGNASVRCGDKLLITPTGVAPDALAAEDMVLIDRDGHGEPGALRPSSEWRMHWGVLEKRPELSAVVHCHSRHATILACSGRGIPAVHYMVAVAGRTDIPLAPYYLFGTEELAQAVVDTLGTGYACLMANHGQIAVSTSMQRALSIAEEVEEQAAVYWGTLCIGGTRLLSADEMQAVQNRFLDYGQPPPTLR